MMYRKKKGLCFRKSFTQETRFTGEILTRALRKQFVVLGKGTQQQGRETMQGEFNGLGKDRVQANEKNANQK